MSRSISIFVMCLIALVSSSSRAHEKWVRSNGKEVKQVIVRDLAEGDTRTLVPESINSKGGVVGFEELQGQPRRLGFEWNRSGVVRSLMPFEDDLASVALAINDSGLIAGESFPAPFNLGRGVLWILDGNLLDIGNLGGGGASIFSINNYGDATGTSRLPNSDRLQPFRWTARDGMEFLGSLGGTQGQANSINDEGEVVGYSEDSSLVSRGFFWSQEVGMQGLGLLPESAWCNASDINNSSEVVGTCRGMMSDHWMPFYWTAKAGMTPLGNSGGEGIAVAINDLGEVVGAIKTDTGYKALLVSSDGQWIDMNLLLPDTSEWFLEFGHDINIAGEVIGMGRRDGELRGVLIVPDTDGDGVEDRNDACVDSELGANIVFGACDTHVPNLLAESGCTMTDRLMHCGSVVKSKLDYSSCVRNLIRDWRRKDLINASDGAKILRCARRQ